MISAFRVTSRYSTGRHRESASGIGRSATPLTDRRFVDDPVRSITAATRRTPGAMVNIDLRVRLAGLIRPGHKQIKSRLNPAQIVTNSHLNNDHVRGVTVSQNVAN